MSSPPGRKGLTKFLFSETNSLQAATDYDAWFDSPVGVVCLTSETVCSLVQAESWQARPSMLLDWLWESTATRHASGCPSKGTALFDGTKLLASRPRAMVDAARRTGRIVEPARSSDRENIINVLLN